MKYLLVLSACLLSSIPSFAHPGSSESHPALRTWNLYDGNYHLHASFVVARSGEVQLRAEDGSTFWIPERFLSSEDKKWVEQKLTAIKELNTFVSVEDSKIAPVLAKYFEPFKETVKVRWDEKWLYVESNGLPDHLMMKGIKNWQQQVPLPQPYSGKNAWQIPLKPELAEKPISAKNNLFRGAIALAINGVPIFNALNNRGEDSFAIGELDEWGGHCGRADDYHYHAAPIHLEKKAGKGNPIAVALDGFAIYGFTEADGSPAGKLDEFNGKIGKDGVYRYHATKTYPYINGGMRGVVEVRGGQVDPQPRAFPMRPAGEPLRGASITNFSAPSENSFKLTYEVRRSTRTIEYSWTKDGTAKFIYDDGDGNKKTETYLRREGKDKKDGPPPKKN
ncbi:YHYH protein [Telmatocola sphagniphila]|uniref:YHYH protein n=1 Tax=Telmatocola sphagniphila TaxID=1123043 RepID=A0A8E6EV59_9BACT|nr:YHYH protein [Telmatocola sphagniphila]QVL34534.1 YHYH protein [Telmatocola sphagniphila]